MDLVRFHSRESQQSAASAPIHQPASLFGHSSSSHTGFPIIAVAIIGILATALLLVGYYIFVIKCCLNWHRIDLLRRFSLSRSRRRVQDPFPVHSPVPENRGLDELVIRSIPIFKFIKDEKDEQHSSSPKSYECAVCLNEFQEEEKLRVIPNCAHVFHIDCIDIWLQNNSNCPLCRTSISAVRPVFGLSLDPTSFPQDPNPFSDSFTGRDEDYVVIEVGAERETTQLLSTTSPLQKKSSKKAKKVKRVSSMGDECIDIREKDERFAVQPIRRSFSMDSAADRQLYLAVEDIRRQSTMRTSHDVPLRATAISPSEDYCSSSRLKRSFFSFGQGRGSRTAVQPVLFSSMEP